MNLYGCDSPTPRVYDQQHCTIGIEIALGYLASQAIPPSALLNIGCSASFYAAKLAQKGCQIVCLEDCIDKLRRCRNKMRASGVTNYQLMKGDLISANLPPRRFDMILCDYPLHAFDGLGEKSNGLEQFLDTAFSILKPEGKLLIHSFNFSQLRDGVWWGELVAPAIERMRSKIIENEDVHTLLGVHGFVVNERVIPMAALAKQPDYFDPNALRRTTFQHSSTHLALLTKEEIEQLFTQLENMQQQGTLDTYIAKRDRLRRVVGQCTYHIARRA